MKYGSADASHVPPPDPDNYWTFSAGQPRVIGTRLSFRVDELRVDHINGTQTFGGQTVHGQLWLDMPVVILRDASTSEPLVTLTLRAVDAQRAQIQVTAHPDMARLSMN